MSDKGGASYPIARALSTTACIGRMEDPSVMSTKRTPELLRTDRTHPETSTSRTFVSGRHALRSATVLMACDGCWPMIRTEYFLWLHGRAAGGRRRVGTAWVTRIGLTMSAPASLARQMVGVVRRNVQRRCADRPGAASSDLGRSKWMSSMRSTDQGGLSRVKQGQRVSRRNPFFV